MVEEDLGHAERVDQSPVGGPHEVEVSTHGPLLGVGHEAGLVVVDEQAARPIGDHVDQVGPVSQQPHALGLEVGDGLAGVGFPEIIAM